MTQNELLIVAGEYELIDRVKPLWHELRAHHAELAPTWKSEFLDSTFEGRIDRLVRKAAGGLNVLLATLAGRDVGYCICSIDETHQAEIDSILVTAEHRGRGVGQALMREAMQWLSLRSPRAIIIDVLAANEAAQRLYRGFGFQPRTMVMRHVPPAVEPE